MTSAAGRSHDTVGRSEKTAGCAARHRRVIMAQDMTTAGGRRPAIVPMKSLDARDRKLIRQATLFAGLPDAVRERLLTTARVVAYPRGKVLFLRGDPAERIYLVLDGWVKVFRDTKEGEQIVIHIMRPGETVAEAAAFLGHKYPASAEVVENARLVEIPAGPFLAMLREDSELALKMLGALSLRLHQLVRQIEQLQTRSVPQRLGEFLLGLCDATEGSATVQLPYDKVLVAARLGMKPESLSRGLAKLRVFGVVSDGNMVRLGDVARLTRYCQGEERLSATERHAGA